MLISSMTTAFTPSGSSAFFEKTGFASSLYVISSRRWIVFASLPDKDKKELVGQIVPGQPVPYDERLGWTKDEYAKYLECWKLKQVQEVAPVALGIFASGERNIWELGAVEP